jgi:hypothetical protein
MSTLHGIVNNQIYAQPGFSASRDDKGGWRGSAEFAVTAATWSQSYWRAQFSNGTSITTLDPTLDPFFSFLTVESQTVTRNEGELVTVNVELTGSSEAQYNEGDLSDESLPTYRLEGRTFEMPFAEHPKWKALSEVEQIALGKLLSGDYLWGPDPFSDPDSPTNFTYILVDGKLRSLVPDPITSTDAQEFANRISKGNTSYLMPTITYTESTQGNSPMTAAQLNKIGKISTPRGNPPAVTGNRDWMLTSASQEQRGELYQTNIEWTLSEREGWDTFFYE